MRIFLSYALSLVPVALMWIVIRVVVRRSLRFVSQIIYETCPGDPWESDELQELAAAPFSVGGGRSDSGSSATPPPLS